MSEQLAPIVTESNASFFHLDQDAICASADYLVNREIDYISVRREQLAAHYVPLCLFVQLLNLHFAIVTLYTNSHIHSIH